MVVTLKVESLRKEFKGFFGKGKKTLAVAGIDFAVEKGEIFGLLGPNGAGKTTTIKMICGLVKPTSGRIIVNGYDIVSQRRNALASLGVVLEGNRNIYWSLTPRENLEYFANLRGKKTREIKGRIEELLKFFELWERRDSLISTLSRGMQQKVAIATALVTDPPILLLDEPTLGLDVSTTEAVKQEIVKFAKKDGKTILLATHQMEVAQAICDRVAIINKGKIVVQDSPTNLVRLFATRQNRIYLKGKLTEGQKRSLMSKDGLQINEQDGLTELVMTFRDVSMLYEVIEILGQTRIPILALERQEPNLAEVFLQLTRRGR